MAWPYQSVSSTSYYYTDLFSICQCQWTAWPIRRRCGKRSRRQSRSTLTLPIRPVLLTHTARSSRLHHTHIDRHYPQAKHRAIHLYIQPRHPPSMSTKDRRHIIRQRRSTGPPWSVILPFRHSTIHYRTIPSRPSRHSRNRHTSTRHRLLPRYLRRHIVLRPMPAVPSRPQLSVTGKPISGPTAHFQILSIHENRCHRKAQRMAQIGPPVPHLAY